MQSSGLANPLNPLQSVAVKLVLGIPNAVCDTYVGWRGQPGEHDSQNTHWQGHARQNFSLQIGFTFGVMSETLTEITEVIVRLSKKAREALAGSQLTSRYKRGTSDTSIGYMSRFDPNSFQGRI